MRLPDRIGRRLAGSMITIVRHVVRILVLVPPLAFSNRTALLEAATEAAADHLAAHYQDAGEEKDHYKYAHPLKLLETII